MDKNTLIMVGEWAQTRVASGEEPPWTFYKLKQLAEIAQELAEGMDAATLFETTRTIRPTENVVQIDDFRPAKEPELALPT